MYKLILVPVDGSSFSEQILPNAAAIARSTGAELLLLRAVDKQKDEPEAARYVEALAQGLGARSACVLTDDVAATIVAEAARLPETLIALGSHGRTGAMQALFGNTALAVLRASRAPVLVFRQSPERGTTAPDRIQRVVLPLDGSALSESMIGPAAALAKWLGARVEVVSVVAPSSLPGTDPLASDASETGYVRATAEKIARDHGLQTSWEVLHGDPKEAIPDYLRGQSEGSIVAMATHGHGALGSALVGSVTSACLRRGGVPVYTKLH